VESVVLRRLLLSYSIICFPWLSVGEMMTMADTMASSTQAAENSDELMSLNRADAFAAIASLLSTSQLEKESEFHRVQEFSSMTDRDNLREVMVSCPCLSLLHEKEGHLGAASDHCADRKHVEDHAVSLLARPLLEVVLGDEKQLGAEPGLNISRSARTLLQNIYSSFAVLVDSRLHAYTEFLASHARALSSKKYRSNAVKDADTPSNTAVRGIEEKLATILATGTQVETDTLVTRFELQEEGSDDLVEGSTESSAMLSFVVAMDFAVPRPHGKKEVVSVSFSTTGKIAGTCTEASLTGYGSEYIQ
jgi:hypothetical protein